MINQEKDWLAQEIRYESKISAWDLDEPNKVKALHEENCPREQLANQHFKVHQGNQDEDSIQSNLLKSNHSHNYGYAKKALTLSELITVAFMIILFIIFFIY